MFFRNSIQFSKVPSLKNIPSTKSNHSLAIDHLDKIILQS